MEASWLRWESACTDCSLFKLSWDVLGRKFFVLAFLLYHSICASRFIYIFWKHQQILIFEHKKRFSQLKFMLRRGKSLGEDVECDAGSHHEDFSRARNLKVSLFCKLRKRIRANEFSRMMSCGRFRRRHFWTLKFWSHSIKSWKI